jgi:hypothetical protein
MILRYRMARLTHGETYYLKRQELDLSLSLSKIVSSFYKMPKKMNRVDALKYYGRKFKEYFDFNYEQEVESFKDANEYFDFLEARKIVYGK